MLCVNRLFLLNIIVWGIININYQPLRIFFTSMWSYLGVCVVKKFETHSPRMREEEGERKKYDNETGTNLTVICLFSSNHAVGVRDEGWGLRFSDGQLCAVMLANALSLCGINWWESAGTLLINTALFKTSSSRRIDLLQSVTSLESCINSEDLLAHFTLYLS